MDESPAIKLKIDYSFSDAIHSHRYFTTRSLGGLFEKFFAAAAFAIGAIDIYISLSRRTVIPIPLTLRDFVIPLLFFAASIAIWFDLAYLFGMWQVYNRRKRLSQREYEFTIDNSGIRYILSDEQDVKFNWSQFRDIRESNRSFFLVIDNSNYWTLPKRSFATRDEMRAFRDLANRHVENARL